MRELRFSEKGLIMTRTDLRSARPPHRQGTAWILSSLLAAVTATSAIAAGAQTNLLLNPGFEEPAGASGALPQWSMMAGGGGTLQATDQSPHGGKQALTIPVRTAVEQKIASAKTGAYVARAWVKSPADQTVSLLVQDASQPWAGYTVAEIRVPANQWTQIETFCSLEKDGSLTFTLGDLSADFRNYHGVSGQMRSPIVVDDLELVRYEPQGAAGPVTAWDVKPGDLDWSKHGQWSQAAGNALTGTGAIQTPRLVGIVRPSDGSLEISAIQGDQVKPRCMLVPSVALADAKCSILTEQNKKGLRVSSAKGDVSYTAWFTPEGLVSVTADHIPQFQIKDCHLRYGLLPSFAGTDVLYAPERMEGSQFKVPSTQWLVGLGDGNDSMLVAVWESDTQAVSLGLSGEGEKRRIDSMTIATAPRVTLFNGQPGFISVTNQQGIVTSFNQTAASGGTAGGGATAKAGFSLGLVEHANLWGKEALKEEWLGTYTPIAWQRSFPARWMCQFFVTPASKPTFREPCMDYAFPVASARTRQYGVWFEDWNRYPFYFEGPQTVLHFEKTFVPNGEALFYFLEPAAADFYSPCEIVEQALGRDKALALFDFDANGLRKLKYSTPDEFIYDRPVCATTDRITAIRQAEKATIGVNLATHLYEFMQGIRSRVDQYNDYFKQTQDYLAGEKKAHPELREYLEELQAMVTEAQAESRAIYATSLTAIQAKTDAMKKRLLEGTGNGFDMGDLNCEIPAGWQDDLCRRYNRFVMRLVQTAAQKCGDSPEKAVIAKHIWDESRGVLRQPTRWESRRSLYFFEP